MADERTPAERGGLSRGDFLKRGGAALGGAVLGGAGASTAWARPRGPLAHEAASTIKIGYVSPLTGPAAGFGEPDPYAISLAKAAFAKGLKIGGKTYAVQIIDKDSQSVPSTAAQVTQQLISGSGVDLLLATSTPEVVVPVSTAAEAAGVPCVSTVVPWEAWWLGVGGKLGPTGNPTSPALKWIYHFSFGVPDFAAAYLSLWKQIPTNKKVGVMWPNDDDGNAIRGALGPVLKGAGYTIVDPGAYQDGTNDYTPQITEFKQQDCQIFNTFPIPPDFTTFWRQAAQQGYTKQVKIAQIAKTGLFASQIDAVGSLGYNLASGEYWGPTWPYHSSLTGISSAALGAGYTKKTGRYPNQQLGASLALFDVAAAALKASGNPKDKAAVANALSKLQVQTPVGVLNWGAKGAKNPVGNIVATPIVGNQWRKAAKGSRFNLSLVICENADDPKIPVASKLVPYS
ncbi:MAG TPA: ABC transporter substrate-binding protein [Solirubrobacteraceae bacterium]|nr:ABC transporter substrate-binding protein [Solirubrobacteraceae bacterium]